MDPSWVIPQVGNCESSNATVPSSSAWSQANISDKSYPREFHHWGFIGKNGGKTLGTLTTQKTNICPPKRDYTNRKYIFQPSFFRGYVSFQVGNNQHIYTPYIVHWFLVGYLIYWVSPFKGLLGRVKADGVPSQGYHHFPNDRETLEN